jgi:hypothetical protein
MRNRSLTVGLMTAWLVACGSQGEQPSFDEGDPVGTVTQASSDADAFIDRAPVQNASKLAVQLGQLSDQASKVANIIGKASSYAEIAVSALQMLGYIQSEAEIEQARFDALHLHLDNLGVELVEVDLAVARDDRLSLMRTSVNNVNKYARRYGGPIDESDLTPSEADELGNARTDSQHTAQFSTEISAHEGYYHEAVTNGDRCTGSSHQDWFLDADCWKRYVSARPGPSGTVAYDWRLGTAEMLQLIASRLAIIGMTDPNFRTNGEYVSELWQYWTKLEQYHQKMMDGIHCWGVDGNPVNVGCVDIHTGLEVSTTFVEPSCHYPYNATTCQARIAPYKERFKRSLMTRLPLFQVRSMMNALARSMSTNDELTANPRIRMWGSQNCLQNYQNVEYDTNPYEPTPIPGQWSAGVATCSGDVAQEWHYDRATGQITNAWGACLGQRSFDTNHPHWQGSLLVKACTNEGGEHWTYDPWSGVLESAFHTVLGAPLQHGTWGPTIPKAELPGASWTQAWDSPPLENLALNKPSWQSSTVWGYPDASAAKANDGNTDGWFWNWSVSHTSNGWVYPGQWHMAGQHWYTYLSPNFGSERRVKKINIYNRTDCCGERLSHYNVLAWISADEEWRVISDHSNDTSAQSFVSIDVDVLTRYVMIAKTNDDYLQLAEVEVLGY